MCTLASRALRPVELQRFPHLPANGEKAPGLCRDGNLTPVGLLCPRRNGWFKEGGGPKLSVVFRHPAPSMPKEIISRKNGRTKSLVPLPNAVWFLEHRPFCMTAELGYPECIC